MEETTVFEEEIEILQLREMTPDLFFGRTLSMARYFEELDEDLQRSYNDPNFHPSNRNIASGLLVISIGGLFHRAQFIGIEEDLVSAFLIDEGFFCKVKFSQCFGIDQRFLELPALCFRCHLSLKPVDDQWSEEALNFFLDKIQQGGNKVIFKNDIAAERMSAAVDIVWKETIVDNPFDVGREVSVYLSQELITKKYAVHEALVLDLGIDEEINGPLLSSDGIVSTRSIPIANSWNSEESTTQFENEDDRNSDEVEDTPVTKWLPSVVPVRPLNTWTKICVLNIDDVGQIHYQLKSDREKFRGMKEFFYQLYDEARPLYEEDDCNLKKQKWLPGEACVVLYEKDNDWYRATVVGEISSVEYRVFFVDCGRTLGRVNICRMRYF